MSDTTNTQIACPYVAGGCPLFNTVVPVTTPSCSGGCSPPAEKAESPHPQPQRRPSAPQPELPPLPSFPESSLWSTYGSFALSPKPFEIETYPFPGPELLPSVSVSAPERGCGSGGPMPEKRGLTDIEELMMQPKRPRVMYHAPPVEPVTSAETSSDSGEEEEDLPPTPFISKLVYLLGHNEYAQHVRWDSQGKCVILSHTKPETLDVLTQFFRHTTVASFVRQLNIYGFKRLSTAELLDVIDPAMSPSFSAADLCAFRHPAFFRPSRGHPCRLGGLKPVHNKEKASKAKKAKEA